MHRIGIIVALLLCVPLGQAATAAEWPEGPIGGKGGGYAEAPCPRGWLLAGFYYRSGKALDFIRGYCRKIEADGRLGADTYAGTMYGSPNGATERGTYACPDQMAIRSIRVWVDNHGLVRRLRANCRSLDFQQKVELGQTAVSGGAAARDESMSCGSGHLAKGFIGRSGSLVDALGLLCTDEVGPNGSVPGAQPDPVGPTPQPTTNNANPTPRPTPGGNTRPAPLPVGGG
jgi:hypothetical protein